MRVDIRSNIADLARDLSDVGRKQLPFALSLALNDVAEMAIKELQAHMAQVFDAPTRWTLNAFHFRRATKSTLRVTIERKTAARGRHYLETQEVGGIRPTTGWERQLESKLGVRVGYLQGTALMRRDQHGNIHRGEMQRVLSRVGAASDARANSTAASRKRAKGGPAYFVAEPDARLAPGVYMRTPDGSIHRVIAFDTPTPSYDPRLGFLETMDATAQRRLPDLLARRLAEALASAR